MKKIKITLAPLPLLGALILTFAAGLTAGGQLQSWIQFAGVANEIGFFLLTSFAAVCCLVLGIEVTQVKPCLLRSEWSPSSGLPARFRKPDSQP